MLPRSRSYINYEELRDCLSSHDFTDSAYIEVFEREFAHYLGTKKCIATNQGRAGLLLGLKALNLSKDDEVIVQSFTYPGVMDAIIEAGATPVLVDNSTNDYNASIEAIKETISDRTQVIIATHLFGIPCDIDDILNIANENDCFIIEDCAQCLGGEYKGKRTGTFGDMSFFSFNFEKHLSTGEGGMISVNNKDLIGDVEEVQNQYTNKSIFEDKCYVYGLLIQYFTTLNEFYKTDTSAYFGQDYCKKSSDLFKLVEECVMSGVPEEEMKHAVLPYIRKEIEKIRFIKHCQENRGLNTILKTIVRAKNIFKKSESIENVEIDRPDILMNTPRALTGTIGLRSLEKVNSIRENNAHRFINAIESLNSYHMPSIDDNKKPSYLKYCILNETTFQSSTIFKLAREQEIEMENAQWPDPVHLKVRYKERIPHDRTKLQISEYIASHIINIPNHIYITEGDMNRIIEILSSFSKG